MSSAPVKIGIVGVGGYGRHLLDVLLSGHETGAVSLVAAVVVDPITDRPHVDFLRARSPATLILDRWDELLSSGAPLDLAVLPVGICDHKPLTVSALSMGWNVLVEKPLASSVADGLAMVEAMEQSGKFVAVGYQDMYGGAVREMKRAIHSGAIGRIERIKAFAIWGRTQEYYRRNAWAGKMTFEGRDVYDSPFNNGLSHYLNMAFFLAGRHLENPAEPVSCEAALFRGHGIESCDTSTIRWQTDAGIKVEVYFSHLTSLHIGPELVIEGSSGSIRWNGGGSWELRPDGTAASRHPVAAPDDLRKAMIRTVLQKARGEDVPVFTPRQALPQVRATAMAHAATTIRDIPPESLSALSGPDAGHSASHWIEVRHLEIKLRTAFEQSRLLTLQDFQAQSVCA